MGLQSGVCEARIGLLCGEGVKRGSMDWVCSLECVRLVGRAGKASPTHRGRGTCSQTSDAYGNAAGGRSVRTAKF